MNFVLAQDPDIKSFKFSDFKVVSKINQVKKLENLILHLMFVDLLNLTQLF